MFSMDGKTKQELLAEVIEAMKAAEQANMAKSDFLASISHEIRTPMNSIIGIGYLLLQTELTAKQRDYMNQIQSSALSLLGIVNDILDFSQIEAGEIILERETFTLKEVLAGVVSDVSGAAKLKNIKLLIAVDPSVPEELLGDSKRLRQIVTHLVNNAVKFTQIGEVNILVRVERYAEKTNSVKLRFTVKDTGIGMSPKQMGKLFSQFTQVDSSTTRKYGGTGLGLTISKRLVDLLCGEITVESQLDQGSTFAFTALFDYVPAELTKTVVQANSTESLVQPSELMGTRILLVEDNSVNRQIAQDMLERLGVIVGTAANGQEAVDMVRATIRAYDAIIMDIQMPHMDGFEATQLIRKIPGCDKIPIIAMTAHNREGAREECLRAGMNDYISKPIEFQKLFEVLTQWLGNAIACLSPQIVKGDQNTSLSLPGINVAIALERLGGNVELFKKLLLAFGEDNRRTFIDIATNLEKKNIGNAQRLIHTLKGVAGNIGATELFEVAAALEIAIKGATKENIVSLVQRLESELALVLASIATIETSKALCQMPVENSSKVLTDLSALVPLLNELHESLQKHSMKASKQIVLVCQQFAGTNFQNEAEAMEFAINKLDFESALSHLHFIAESLQLKLETGEV